MPTKMRSIERALLFVVTLPILAVLVQQTPPVLADEAAATTDDVSSSSTVSMSYTTANCDESLTTPPALSCPDQERLKMSYVSRGSVDCGDALTIEQAAVSPSIRADPSIVEPNILYSLILVDTTLTTVSSDTFFSFDSVHPILHYGAVNIPGSLLLEGLSLDRTDLLDVFLPYQGPSPFQPGSMWATENVESTLYAYEFMLAAQPQRPVPMAVPQLDSNRNFDYEAFFTETVGVGFSNLTASTHFVSGWCVNKVSSVSGRQDPTVAPTQPLDPIEVPTTVNDPNEVSNEPSADMELPVETLIEAPMESPMEVLDPTESPKDATLIVPATATPISIESESMEEEEKSTNGFDEEEEESASLEQPTVASGGKGGTSLTAAVFVVALWLV